MKNATTTIAYGPGWGWPDDERILDLFNVAVDMLGRVDISWIPGLSEVIAYVDDGKRPRLRLDDLRDACEDIVGYHIANCELPGNCGCPDCPECACDDCRCDCYIDVEELGDLKRFIDADAA
jgi:hypothetical protein